jgi:hypothetical protein
MKRLNVLLILLAVVLAAFVFKPFIRSLLSPMSNKITNRKTVADRLGEFGDAARARLKPGFDNAQVKYPPAGIKLLAVKAERAMEVYATDGSGSNRWIHTYPILAGSSYPGPKLKEGDGQVPEGVYSIESFNPNSSYHVSLRVGYPNEFDRAMAAKEGRTNLGGDIMIHGKNVSIGCLAMGDEAAEDLFVLAADTGLTNISVVITPVDFRAGKTVPKAAKVPAWCDELYAQIKTELSALPQEKSK